MNLAMCEVPVHPVEFLSADGLSALPELPMTQAEDGTYFCDGESTQVVQKQGKNLIDQNKIVPSTSTQIDYIENGIRIKSDVRYAYAYIYIPVKTGTYTLQCNIEDLSGKNFNPRVFVYKVSSDGSESIYTTVAIIGHNAHKIAIEECTSKILLKFACVWATGSQIEDITGGYAEFSDIQLEYGDTATNYESFQPAMPSPDYPSPILNTYPAGTYKAICGDKTYKVTLDDDLRSVPGVADRVRIDAGKGVCWVERKVGLVEYDGSDDEWWMVYNYEKYKGFATNIIDMKIGNHQSGLCSHFPNSFHSMWIGVHNNYLYFIDCESVAETVTDWKTWHYSNPMTVQYILATPTTHQSVPAQLTTISAGRSVTIHNTVNDAVDMLAVKGDSWQLVQEEITDADGNVTQPAMPSPEYPSEIVSVEGEMRSCGWNLYRGKSSFSSARYDNETKYTDYPIFDGLEVGETYTISFKTNAYDPIYSVVGMIVVYDSNIANPIRFSSGMSFVFTETMKSRIGNQVFFYGMRDGSVSEWSDIQIVKSDTQKPYDRHRGNDIALPVLRSLPDGTADVLYVDRAAKRAWVERCVGEYEYTGDEKFTIEKKDDNSGYIGFYNNSLNNKKNGNNLICNYAPVNQSTSVYSKNDCISGRDNNFAVSWYWPISFVGDTVESIQVKFKELYESGDPVTVLYELATPIIEELPYTDYLLETAQYETNIHIGCDEHLEPEISATVKVLGR